MNMSRSDEVIKRLFDMTLALLGLIAFSPIILICWLIAGLETRSNGFFVHQRIGRHGEPIKIIKIKTMYPAMAARSSISAYNLSSITRSGAVFRKYKLDELPQLFNVLLGDMSFVGPRPDIPGYADLLQGGDRVILLMRPGITGPASIKYRNEEELLQTVDDPATYNDQIIWPDKVRINKEYYLNYSLWKDIHCLFRTISRRA
jgi:lipopolysaccharide/colanic/teichoic acid biosynthesis glycosyltransferase